MKTITQHSIHLAILCGNPLLMKEGRNIGGSLKLTDWLAAKLPLPPSSTLILGSEFHGTHDHILLSDSNKNLQNAVSQIVQ
jgi:hypothetical protein